MSAKRETLGSLMDFAVETAWLAGRHTLSYFQAGAQVERKADDSPVTAADRGAERLMRERIERYFPADGILGEEDGEVRQGARRRWVLDPIDGTRSFIHGVPLYGVLLALEEAGEVLLGVLHFPALQESVWAGRGEGCWWDGRRARVSEVERLEEALICSSSAEDFEKQGLGAGWEALCKGAQDVRTWGDAYGYALVATGRAEAMLDATFSVWDAAAVLPVIEEAGGRFTDVKGARSHLTGSGVGTNAALAGAVRKILGGGA